MPSQDFLRRMETVLAARAEEKTVKDAPRSQRALRISGAVLGALTLFFVLKAAALAHSNRPFHIAAQTETGIVATVQHWFAGADPVTRTLAQAMRASTG